tara:strand:- start:356 stop:616 length:261 start_codon:yes stop_codon:yes gene_type:complete
VGKPINLTTGVGIMKIMIVGNKRKDGKYKVKYYYEGAPNMFGGRDHGKCFTVLEKPSAIHATLKRAGLESAENMDQFYALEGKGDV